MSHSQAGVHPSQDQDWLDPAVITWAVVPTAIAIVVVALRFYTRHCLIKKIEIEDWLALGALLLAIGNSIGTGRRKSFNPPS